MFYSRISVKHLNFVLFFSGGLGGGCLFLNHAIFKGQNVAPDAHAKKKPRKYVSLFWLFEKYDFHPPSSQAGLSLSHQLVFPLLYPALPSTLLSALTLSIPSSCPSANLSPCSDPGASLPSPLQHASLTVVMTTFHSIYPSNVGSTPPDPQRGSCFSRGHNNTADGNSKSCFYWRYPGRNPY